MKKTVIFLCFFCFWTLFSSLDKISACEPQYWSISSLTEDSKAESIVYGEVMEIKKSGRQATLKVISYIGKKEAPSIIQLPPTVDSRNAQDDCGDFSLKFQSGERYIVFLASDYPKLQLLNPSGITALLVNPKNEVNLETNNKTGNIENVLNDLSQKMNYKIKLPDDSSPIWGDKTNYFKYVWIPVCFIIILLTVPWVRKSFKR